MIVIWVPHHEVREMYPNETFGAVQVLDSLAEFKPERWALPGV
jgi:pseudouridine-5'-monophosphatase